MSNAFRHSLWTSSGLTTKKYVQDGLIAMWDGIENIGFKKHSSSTKIWKNLGSLGSNYDAIRVRDGDSDPAYGTGIFSEIGAEITRDGTNTRFKVLTNDLQPKMAGEWSYEVVFTPRSGWKSNYSGLLGCHGGNGIVGGQYENGQFSFNLYPPNRQLWLVNASTFSIGQLTSVSQSVSATTGIASTYKNGLLVNSVSNNALVITEEGFFIGSAFPGNYYGNRNFDGVIHCIRIYNRPISQIEVAANHEIDIKRFNV